MDTKSLHWKLRVTEKALKYKKQNYDADRVKAMITYSKDKVLERQAGEFNHPNLHRDVRLKCKLCGASTYKHHIMDWVGDVPVCPCCGVDQLKKVEPLHPGLHGLTKKKKRKTKSFKSAGGITLP